MLKKVRPLNGIGLGSAIGLAISVALYFKTPNSNIKIAMGLAIGVTIGAIFDFFNRNK
jgi:F0F1-type ATP synthase membrane subunit a